MQCGSRHGKSGFKHAASNCCCGGHGSSMNNEMWSSKKKIRFLENQLKNLNGQKSDIQELIEELKGN